MAGDWIKIRTDLYRHPKLAMMADELLDREGPLAQYVNQNMQRDMTVTRNVMRNVTVGALVSIWGVVRVTGKRNGDDLFLLGASVDVLDDVAELPGIGAAMESVGWVVCCPEGLKFPNFFEEFNSDPSDRVRAANAERQRRFREKSNVTDNALRNVTDNVTVTPREEESREEESKKGETPLPPLLDTEEFRLLWGRWRKHRTEIKKPLKPTQEDSQLKMLNGLGMSRATAMVEHTIAMGWQGLKEPDNGTSGSTNGPPKQTPEQLADEAQRIYEERKAQQ